MIAVKSNENERKFVKVYDGRNRQKPSVYAGSRHFAQARESSKSYFEPCYPHQTQEIRTKFSLWETGSDFFFYSLMIFSRTARPFEKTQSREAQGKRKSMMILLRIYPFKMCQMTKRIYRNERMVFKMKKHYTDEKTGISYTLHGDVYLPDLVYSEHKYPPLGKYGMLRQTYLKENHKLLYSRMLMNDTR